MLPGISMMTPSDRLTSVGVPQPSLAIGPIRNVPCCRREDRAQVADDLRRVGDDVVREQDAVDRAGAHALRQRLERIVRLRPSRPPTPISVKP